MTGREPDDGAAAPAGRGARIALAAAGLLLVAAGYAFPVVRVPGGGTSIEGWWIGQAGLAVALAGQGLGRPTRRAALLASLLLLAASAQLALTSPLWLQYLDLRPARLAAGVAPFAVAVLAIQAAVVALALRGRLSAFAAAARGLAGPGRVALVLALFVLTAAHASPFVRPDGPRQLPVYAALLAAAAALLVLNLANAWLCIEAVPAAEAARWRARLGSYLSLPGEDRPPTAADAWFPRVLAAAVLAAATFVAVGVFDRVPHLPDDTEYLFQARCIASGSLSAPAPAVPEAFGDYMLDVRDGRWFATTNPGWPAVLALGVLVGAPWLVNPVLGAVSILVAHALVRRWSDRGTAHAVTLLLAASPWFLFLAASHMTHTATLALLLAAWLLITPRDGVHRPVPAACAGLCLGFMVVIRPLDGIAAGALAGLWLVAEARPRWPAAVPYALGCLAGSAPMFAFNAALTGRPLRDPLTDYLDRLWYPGANRLGFGADVGNVPSGWSGLDPLRGHGPADVLVNVNQNLCNLNVELTGWATGSLVLVLVHVLWGRWSRLDRRLGVYALAVVATLSCYWFSGGPDFGARYWFLVILPCLWLTVRGAGTLAGLLADRFGATEAPARVGAALALLSAIAVATFVPWRATARYIDYRGYHADYLRLSETGGLGRVLALVRTTTHADAASALAVNPPTLDPDGPLFARDLGPENERRLRAAFPGRPVVRVLGRSVTGTTSRVAGAPR